MWKFLKFNFFFDPREKTQNFLNIQSVIPVDLNEDWLLITRTILPVISQPSFRSGQERENGLGDTVFRAFFSPKDREGWSPLDSSRCLPV